MCWNLLRCSRLPDQDETNVAGWWTRTRTKSGLSSQNAIVVDDDVPDDSVNTSLNTKRAKQSSNNSASDDIVEISSSLVSTIRRLSTPRWNPWFCCSVVVGGFCVLERWTNAANAGAAVIDWDLGKWKAFDWLNVYLYTSMAYFAPCGISWRWHGAWKWIE
jgi:hypothetical protein